MHSFYDTIKCSGTKTPLCVQIAIPISLQVEKDFNGLTLKEKALVTTTMAVTDCICTPATNAQSITAMNAMMFLATAGRARGTTVKSVLRLANVGFVINSFVRIANYLNATNAIKICAGDA